MESSLSMIMLFQATGSITNGTGRQPDMDAALRARGI